MFIFYAIYWLICNAVIIVIMINFICNAFLDIFYICSLNDKKLWNILVLVSMGQCQNWEYSREKKISTGFTFFLFMIPFLAKKILCLAFPLLIFLLKNEKNNAVWKVEKIIQHLIKQKETFWSAFILRFFYDKLL